MREIMVQTHDGTFKVEVPDDAKLTYGYFNPGQKENPRGFESNQDQRRACLRVYKGSPKNGVQLAAFTGVVSFRDTELKVTRLVAKVKGEEQFWQDDDGNMERTSSRQVSIEQLPELPATVIDD
jgi:hypothetical protein